MCKVKRLKGLEKKNKFGFDGFLAFYLIYVEVSLCFLRFIGFIFIFIKKFFFGFI